MCRLTSLTKWHVLGLIGALALAMVAATAIAGTLVSNQASAHGGDATLVHACVNTADGLTLGDVKVSGANGAGGSSSNCDNIPGTWTPLDLDGDWSGAGTGSLYPANLSDNIGIGTSNPLATLHVGEGTVLFDGTAGGTPVGGAGTRFMYVPAKGGAIRAGIVDGAQWDDANIGVSSANHRESTSMAMKTFMLSTPVTTVFKSLPKTGCFYPCGATKVPATGNSICPGA